MPVAFARSARILLVAHVPTFSKVSLFWVGRNRRKDGALCLVSVINQKAQSFDSPIFDLFCSSANISASAVCNLQTVSSLTSGKF